MILFSFLLLLFYSISGVISSGKMFINGTIVEDDYFIWHPACRKKLVNGTLMEGKITCRRKVSENNIQMQENKENTIIILYVALLFIVIIFIWMLYKKITIKKSSNGKLKYLIYLLIWL